MRYILSIIMCLSLHLSQAQNKDAFILTWDTRNEGYGDSTQIIVPLIGNYSISWTEIDNNQNSGFVKNCHDNTMITFPNPGKYQLLITGNLRTMNFETYTINSIPKYGKFDYKFLSVDQWGTTIWESFNSFFWKCCNIKFLADDAPNLSQVTSFRQAFAEAKNFNSPIDHWNMSNVKDMSYMFYDALKFNQPLNSWDVSNAENMHSMFGHAEVFNQPLDHWDVSHVYKMSGTFNHAYRFNQNIESWNVSNVYTMSVMFDGASSFNQPLNGWDVSKVQEMNLMFMNADSFNQPIEKWDVSSVNATGFGGMFYMADAFNQPLNNWPMPVVSSLSNMFVDAKSFNQPLDKWPISPDCHLHTTLTTGEPRGIFSGTAMSEENLILTLGAWNRMDIIDIFLDK